MAGILIPATAARMRARRAHCALLLRCTHHRRGTGGSPDTLAAARSPPSFVRALSSSCTPCMRVWACVVPHPAAGVCMQHQHLWSSGYDVSPTR